MDINFNTTTNVYKEHQRVHFHLSCEVPSVPTHSRNMKLLVPVFIIMCSVLVDVNQCKTSAKRKVSRFKIQGGVLLNSTLIQLRSN